VSIRKLRRSRGQPPERFDLIGDPERLVSDHCSIGYANNVWPVGLSIQRIHPLAALGRGPRRVGEQGS
jgi:hypothetical protein